MERPWVGLATAALAVWGCAAPRTNPVAGPPSPMPEATWPWPSAKPEKLHPGIRRWQIRSPDGADLRLVEFDFQANPRLRFELYDQDEDDAEPFDNRADYFPRGVGWVARHLNGSRPGRVVAAWNGLFFAYDRRKGGPHGVATHIGPNVLQRTVRYNVGNHRWAFGVKQIDDKPRFQAIHLADKRTLAREFDFAAVGAQCLIHEGKPLRLRPYPQPDDPPLRQPVSSTTDEAGHIPLVDHMRTSRTSMGWSKDGSKLWLLAVVEADHELGSKLAVKRNQTDPSGWTLDDLQRFWIAFGAWGAVNSDGGAVTQLVTLLPDGHYELVPPRIASPERKTILGPDLLGASEGGTLMSFYVREAPIDEDENSVTQTVSNR